MHIGEGDITTTLFQQVQPARVVAGALQPRLLVVTVKLRTQ